MKWSCSWIGILLLPLVCTIATPCSASGQIPGDCDNNGIVTIAEVQSAINMFLGVQAVAGCVDTDNSGVVSIAEVQKVINAFLGLDVTPPTVSITTPANATSATGITTVSVSATDNVAVTKVEFYVNNVIQTTLASAPYNFSWNTASLSYGSYTLVAKAYDAAGNVGQSASVSVSVPIAVSMNLVPVSGGTWVGTVSLSGLYTSNVLGIDVKVSMPKTDASIASVTGSDSTDFAEKGADGVTINFIRNPTATLKSFGTMMQITFANVPNGATAGDFSVSLLDVFSGGVEIQ